MKIMVSMDGHDDQLGGGPPTISIRRKPNHLVSHRGREHMDTYLEIGPPVAEVHEEGNQQVRLL